MYICVDEMVFIIGIKILNFIYIAKLLSKNFTNLYSKNDLFRRL